jgi:Spx/MgsR family transcriptional regulator
MSLVIYGIRNCDTIKKTLKWLDSHAIAYRFHDYRKDGLSSELLQEFITALGWQALLNKRGTTYRGLSDAAKQGLDEQSAMLLMLEQPALIKRPLLHTPHGYLLGFDETQFQTLLG